RHRLARDYAGRNFFDDIGELGVDRALAVDRQAERIDHAAEQLRPDRYRENLAGAFHRVALGDVRVLAQNHRADAVTLEIERETEGVLRKLEHLALHDIGEAMDAADAVGHRYHGSLRAHLHAGVEVLDAALDEFG